MIIALGISIDFAYAYNVKIKLQSAADSAVLTAAANYTTTTPLATTKATVVGYLAANNSTASAQLVGDPAFSSDNSQLCITATQTVTTSFMGIVGVSSLPVRVASCAGLPGYITTEVALVLDVSSSMIEQSRFTPMQDAVKGFISSFSSGTIASRVRVSIVPFSSRFSFGTTHTSWLKSYGGYAAVPTRWTNPSSVYSTSSYTISTWVGDNTTPLAYNGKNYYWMGCVEPRSDVEVKDGGKIGTYGLTDAAPTTSAFVPMDSNSQSSKSFCPPPITPLTSSFSALTSAVNNLTSEGSTRLDAGMIAGWYTLSPKWKTAWGTAAAPADYSNTIQKIVVFMTDGDMNTQYGQSSGKLDWRCYTMQSTSTSEACNDAATSDLLTICTAMKAQGIKIYSVAYSSDADIANISSCSSGASYFYTASSSSSSASYITTIYDAIAKDIRSGSVRLTQ